MKIIQNFLLFSFFLFLTTNLYAGLGDSEMSPGGWKRNIEVNEIEDIDQKDKDGKLLYASQDGKAKEFSEKNLLISYICHPLMTFKIIAAIHYEALKLWIKGIKIIKRKFKIKNNISIEEK